MGAGRHGWHIPTLLLKYYSPITRDSSTCHVSLLLMPVSLLLMSREFHPHVTLVSYSCHVSLLHMLREPPTHVMWVSYLCHLSLLLIPRETHPHVTWVSSACHVSLLLTSRESPPYVTWASYSCHVRLLLMPRESLPHVTWVSYSCQVASPCSQRRDTTKECFVWLADDLNSAGFRNLNHNSSVFQNDQTVSKEHHQKTTLRTNLLFWRKVPFKHGCSKSFGDAFI